MKAAATILCETFGWDASEARDYRYQDTKTTRAIYAVGNTYYTTGKTKPTDIPELNWEKAKDQFFAARAGTVLWFATAGGAS